MKDTRILMGMPVTVEIADDFATEEHLDQVYAFFKAVDERFSTYKETSEISAINAGRLTKSECSDDMRTIMSLCKQTEIETNGYFNCEHNGYCDPSGIVKGWAIYEAAKLIHSLGYRNFQVDAGGDIQVEGLSSTNKPWIIGIRNPFNHEEIIKRVSLTTQGIATSGTAVRGQHIYNPHKNDAPLEEIVSITVIAENILEADRFATAAFAMQADGIRFIASLPGFEAYTIDAQGIATFTAGFNQYLTPASL